MARSNGFPFQVIDAAPFTGAGFEVRVIHQRDFGKLCKLSGYINPPPVPGSLPIISTDPHRKLPLATIARFLDLKLTTEISGVGGGSITLDLDDPFWAGTLTNGEPATTLLEYEHLWQVFEDGALRGGFLGQVINEAILPVDNRSIRTVTISGPGPADVLRWGVVMTPWYPDPAPVTAESPYNFKQITHMGAWLTLLADCQKRATLDFVCPGFDRLVDTGGVAWPDTPVPPPDPTIVTEIISGEIYFGVDLYSLSGVMQDKLAGICANFSKMKAPQVTIVGHTDSTNTMAYNQTLSVNRATSVANFIRSRVPQVVLNVSGKGETQPIDTNKTVRGRERNRRVVVTYPVGLPVNVEVYFAPTFGGNLLDLLNEWTGHDPDQPSPLRAEWVMHPTFRLDVRLAFGTRREKEVIFYEGSTATISKDRERRRADIRNFLIAQGGEGNNYVMVSDPDSRQRWRQREKYFEVSAATNVTARNDIAAGTLALDKNETTQWNIALPPYAEGRRVFQDYSLGDWIGVARFMGGAYTSVEPFRVLAITIGVDNNSQVSLELMLQSKDESYLSKLRGRLSSLINHPTGVTVFIQNEEPTTAKIGDLWTPLFATGS